MEAPASKKIKLSSNVEKLNFLDLNDDCLDAILERMPPTTLGEISLTCTKLKGMAEDVFRRKHSNECVTIVASEASVKFSTFAPKYSKHFSKLIKNVRIINKDCNDLKIVFAFIESECCDDLKSLDLELGFALNLKSERQVDGSRIRSAIYNSLMKYRESLEHFGIKTVKSYNNDWLYVDFPNLKSLSIDFHYGGECKQLPHFSDFIQRHPQIIHFKCVGIALMTRILRDANHIERLHWSLIEPVSEESMVYDEFIDALRNHCTQNPIESFGIHYGVYCGEVDYILEINSIQPIHDLSVHLDQSMEIIRLVDLNHLIELDLEFVIDKYIPFHAYYLELAVKLPTLKKIAVPWYGRNELYGIALPFVGNAMNLTELTLKFWEWDDEILYDRFDLINLNENRLKLNGACNMTIKIDLTASVDPENIEFESLSNGILNAEIILADKLRNTDFL